MQIVLARFVRSMERVFKQAFIGCGSRLRHDSAIPCHVLATDAHYLLKGLCFHRKTCDHASLLFIL